jgi:hypothetical protein
LAVLVRSEIRGEVQWRACTDPRLMLAFVLKEPNDRKLRLFAAACARRHWGVCQEEGTRQAADVGERFADGMASSSERQGVYEAIQLLKEAAIAEQDFETAARLRAIQAPVYPNIREAVRYARVWDDPQEDVICFARSSVRLSSEP